MNRFAKYLWSAFVLTVIVVGLAAVGPPPPIIRSWLSTNGSTGTFLDTQVPTWDAAQKKWKPGSGGGAGNTNALTNFFTVGPSGFPIGAYVSNQQIGIFSIVGVNGISIGSLPDGTIGVALPFGSSPGQVLTATAGPGATWSTPSGGGSLTTNANQFLGIPLSIRAGALLTNGNFFGPNTFTSHIDMAVSGRVTTDNGSGTSVIELGNNPADPTLFSYGTTLHLDLTGDGGGAILNGSDFSPDAMLITLGGVTPWGAATVNQLTVVTNAKVSGLTDLNGATNRGSFTNGLGFYPLQVAANRVAGTDANGALTNFPAGTAGQVLTSTGNGAGWSNISSGAITSSMTRTNFVLNTVYTNSGTTPILLSGSSFVVPAAVAGVAELDLMISFQAGAYQKYPMVAVQTIITVGVTDSETNSFAQTVTNLCSYYFTNSSSGIGNSAGIVAGTGQITIIGGGVAGATGPAGPGQTNWGPPLFMVSTNTPLTDFYYPILPANAASTFGSTSAVCTNGNIQFLPYYSGVGGIVDSVMFKLNTAVGASTCRIGIYDQINPTNILPGALIVDSGDIATTATGIKYVAVTPSRIPSGHIIYAAVMGSAAIQFATPNVAPGFGGPLGITTNLANNISITATNLYGALPATAPIFGTNVIYQTTLPFLPLVAIRLSGP